MPQPTAERKPYGTVLIKAKDILDFILTAPDAPTLAEISAGVSAAKPTVFKILTTMTSLGLVWRDDQTKQYFLGTQFAAYGQKALTGFNIAKMARPFLLQLRDETQETINLGVVRNDQVVLIEKLESPNSITLHSTIGGTMNLYSSAMGKAILSTYDQPALAHYLAHHQLTPLTAHTITQPATLTAEIGSVAASGIAIDNEENEPEVYCLGATITQHHHLFGAFSVSTPKYRLTPARRNKFMALMRQTKQAIERAL